MVNDYLTKSNTESINLDEYERICVDYVRLFCDFISNSNKNIDKYIDSTIKDTCVQDDIKKIYVKLINSSFLTLHLIGNNISTYN